MEGENAEPRSTAAHAPAAFDDVRSCYSLFLMALSDGVVEFREDAVPGNDIGEGEEREEGGCEATERHDYKCVLWGRPQLK